MGGTFTSSPPVYSKNVSQRIASLSCVSSGRLYLEERDQVVPVLRLLQATESHLCAWDVLLGVLEVFKQSILTPFDALLLVRVYRNASAGTFLMLADRSARRST